MKRRTLLRSASALALVAGTTLALSGAAPTGAAELGPDDFQISQFANAPSRTAVAYNAADDEYLVVWAEADGSLESRIFGRVIDGAGAATGGAFTIAELGSGDPTTGVIDPDVAWNSTNNEYVVVMAGDDAPDGGGIITSTFEIYAQRVSPAGGLIGSLTEISDMGSNDANGSYDAGEPAIAYNAARNEFLVVWEGDDDTAPLVNGETEIFGQLLTNALGEIGTDTRISNLGVDGDGGTDARSPAVAALNGSYAVVWHGNDLSFNFEIYGQLVDAVDLTEIGGDTLISTDAVNDEAYDPAIAGDPTGSGALVVWEHDNGAGNDFEVAAAPITATGGGISVGSNAVDVSGSGGALNVPQAPAVAFNADTGLYSVVWAGDHGTLTGPGDNEVIHTVLDAGAAVVEAPEVISDMTAPNSTGHPDVAPASGAQYAAVWIGDDAGTGNTQVFGQFVVPATDLEITSVTLTSADPVLEGGVVTYVIEYANNGPIAADAIITDLAPTGVTFDSFSSTGPTPTQRAGDNYSWDVTIPAGGSGTITINGTAGTTQGTVTNTATIATAPGFVDEIPGNDSASDTVYVDAIPTVTVEQAAGQDDPTNGLPVVFDVVFSEPVTWTAGAGLTVGGTAPAPIGVTVGGGPTAYTVSISPAGDGTVIPSLAAAAATDATGNGNLASTSTDNTVTYDGTAPTSQVEQAAGQADPTNGSSVEFTVTFSEDVTGFDVGDVDFTGSTAPGTLSAVVTGGTDVYTVTVSGYTGDGDVVVSVADGAASDDAGSTSLEQASTDATVTVDQTAPTVTIVQAAGQDDPTGTSPVTFDVVFSEPVTGFDNGDVTVGGSAGPTTVVVTPVSATDYTVAVSGMTGDGDVTASVDAAAASDAAGNASVASTSTDGTVTYDATLPTVTVEQAATQDDPTNGTTATFTVTFSEPVTGLTGPAFDVGGTATSAGLSLSGSGTDYEATVTGISTSGTVTLELPAGAAQDTGGNTNLASTSVDNEVTVDQTAPTSQIVQAAGQPDPTNSDPQFTVTFSEPVTGFDETDVDLSTSTTPGTLTAVVTGGPTVYDVTVSGFTDEGDVVALVPDGAAIDLAGNASVATPSPDFVVTIDLTSPTVTIDQATGQADPTNELPVSFTVEFSREVTGFTANDVIVTGSAGATDVSVTAASPTDYTVEVGGAANDGAITVEIGADAVVDIAGNGNPASTSTDDTVTYDTTGPVLTVPDAAVVASTDPGQPGAVVEFVVTSSDPAPASAGDRLGEAAPGSGIICDPASGSFFPIGTTTVVCQAADAAGNVSTDSFQVEVVDDEDPTISSGTNQTVNLSSGTSGPVTYTSPTATDNSGEVTVTCTPASGSTMPVGANTVTCQAADAAGNTASTSFTVTVVAPAGEIPATGGGGTGLVPIALAMVLAGLALITTKRHRPVG